MKRVLGLLGFVVLFASSTASAQEPSSDSPKEESERTWYGYQTLATDGVAIAMTGLGVKSAIRDGFASSNDDTSYATTRLLLVGGGLGYLLGAPTVHALHGHWGKAGASLGLRAAPIALCGGLVAAGGKSGPVAGLGVLVVGIIAAMIVDGAVIANESTPTAGKAALAPTFDPNSKAAGVAFAAVF